MAAGFGQRLRARSTSKPLTHVCGVSLLEISLRQLVAVGVTRVVIVTGHEAQRIELEARALVPRIDAAIETVQLEDWSRPNGWSVIAGARKLDVPFLLVMADHLFGDGLLARLAAQPLDDCDVVLATDALDNPLIDPDDATWVACDDQRRIERIGKTIAPYDAVDCGAFLATNTLAEAIASAIAAGRPGSLSDGMQTLADARRAVTNDVGGVWWLDVDDPRALDLAEAQAAQHIGFLSARTALAPMPNTQGERRVA
ncbi:MAG: NTP transferase domain-containing protein [Erythrobacter sp.]|nr:NTP transferase domain-containing protein [Erythrobacter sp.]